MTRAAAFVCGLLTAVFPGFAHVEPAQLAQDSTMMLDTLEHKQVNQETLRRADTVQVHAREFPRSTKLTIDEIHIFDLSTQPVNVGEKDYTSVPLGQRWETDFLPFPRRSSGTLSVGYGNYVTPTVKGWAGMASVTSELLMRAFYTSSKGAEENRDFHKGEAKLSAGWILPETAGLVSGGRLNTRLGFNGSRYFLYGSTTPAQARSFSRFDAEVSLKASGANESFRRVAVHFSMVRMDDQRRAEEVSTGLELGGGAPVGRTFISGELEIWKDYPALPVPTQDDPFYSRLGFDLRYRLGGSLDLSAGGMLYHFCYSGAGQVWRVVPRASIVWYPGEVVSLYATYEPSISRTSFRSLAEINPYIHSALTVRHTDTATKLLVGAAFQGAEVLRGRAAFSYRHVRAYPVFVARRENLWDVSYTSRTRILSFESEAYLEMGASIVGVRIVWQNSKAEPSWSVDVPYLPNVLIRATGEHKFGFGMRVSTDVRYTGRRFADVQNARHLSPFVLWDLGAEFGKSLLVGAGMTNILDRREGEWEAYAGEPRRVYVWLGYMW